ncbi:MAG: bifunctional adenosylcobinamide kinase/adenosylcobinamide-phosphate guanylyltransferase [Oscillospiraceae bacterium]|nr:bifunctional adenosylcobinamide kinase/adenosylcobinamide-phosphate guanylyltransferase [Oscillospiraceae bacterium]
MAKIAFITGGASSGKSRWAVNCFESCDDVMYMYIADDLDKEIAGRIEYNCKNRGIEWVIKTGADNLVELVEGHKFSILDNLGAYVNRRINEKCPDISTMTEESRREIEQYIIDEIIKLIDSIKDMNGNLLIISTELNYCPIPKDLDQRWFREIMGNINQRIANMCTEVYLAASGIVFKIKG